MPVIFLIFIFSLILRIIKINDFLFFGFEQGRDALVIERIIKNFDFVLVGPSTSIGGLFHGVWFYYLLGIPYFISGGNPLAAVLFLIVLGSLMPLVIFFLAKDIFKSFTWGITASILASLSYEYILYSRWLSNVSPAPFFIALAFLMLWKFISLKQDKFFLFFVISAGIASTFQMILIPQFIFSVTLLVIFRNMGKISFKIWGLSVLSLFLIFLPAIIFDFRNEHITTKSLTQFAGQSAGANGYTLLSGINVFLKESYSHLKLSLINIDSFWIQIGLILFVLAGTIKAWRLKTERKTLLFLLSWFFLVIPLIKISPGNPQYYVGFGLAWILLVCYSLKQLSGSFKGLLVWIFSGLVLLSLFINTQNLFLNKDVFFRTTQLDLNLKDQKSLLDYINKDSSGAPYRFISFTVPFLQPEGWQYLQQYYYPASFGSKDANLVYISIEQGVFPVWENKWIGDLGNTRLESERKFGLIRLQKRIVEK